VKFVYTSLTPANAFDYLTNVTATAGYGVNGAEAPQAADTIAVTNVGTKLDANWLAQVQANGGNGVILIEGCATTTQPLMLEIWGNGQKLGSVPLYLSISGVEQMFRHDNMCAYGNGTPDPLNSSRAFAPNEPDNNGKNLVFLHGYNVNQQEARGVESEIFKRFYWSGSNAKFYGVTWNGAVSQGDYIPDISCNLQTNIVNALLTAPNLAGFLGALPGDTTVVAHSLGNMVVLSAISDSHAAVGKYFMIDSAVAIETIDGSAAANPDMVHPDWAGYTNRLYASEWFNLWSSPDSRSKLTWSNRFGNLGSVDIYNFYSSGEEVLRDFSGTPPDTLASSIANIISEWWEGAPVASYVWVWQEKDKGRMSGNNFISSNHGGWGFNDAAYGTNYYNDYGSGSFYVHMSPTSASQLSNSQLQTNAFFNTSVDAALFAADSSGSTYAAANRNRILSDAIPALALPAGANVATVLDIRTANQRNFDMQANFENSWPSSRGAVQVGAPATGEWHHSDFDYVAYPFTHKLFDKTVNDGNLH
jgi:hypothetical protein